MTHDDLRALPPFARHAWRAVWLEARLLEADPPLKRTVKGEVVGVLTAMFATGDVWRWSDLVMTLREYSRATVNSGLHRLLRLGVIEKAGNGVYRQARQEAVDL